MIAIGVTENGIRKIIGVELQNRESYTSWKEFLIRIKDWGLSGVKLIISDNHEQWLESRYLNMDILREKKIEERMVVEEIAA